MVHSIALKDVLSEEQINELIDLSKKIRRVRCHKVQRVNNTVIFYKTGNRNFPQDIFLILPKSPGVLYSLDGTNPNKIDIDVLNKAKPFFEITGNWYMSRYLMISVAGRNESQCSIPKSIIDHSLRTEELSLDEITE